MRDFQSYREGFLAGLDLKENHKCQIMGYDLFEVLDLIQQQEEKKMAKQIISKKDLDILFQNELQKAAFLRIMDGLVVVMEPDPIEEIYNGVVSLTPTGLRASLKLMDTR